MSAPFTIEDDNIVPSERHLIDPVPAGTCPLATTGIHDRREECGRP
jgi:hypothetical protein